MTADKFIQSYGYHKAGDKGFCKLVSVSTENDNVIYDIGLWFEIIRNNGKALVLRIQSNSITKKPYRNTLLIDGKSQLAVFIGNLRRKVLEQFCPSLVYTDDDQSCIQLEPDRQRISLFNGPINSRLVG